MLTVGFYGAVAEAVEYEASSLCKPFHVVWEISDWSVRADFDANGFLYRNRGVVHCGRLPCCVRLSVGHHVTFPTVLLPARVRPDRFPLAQVWADVVLGHVRENANRQCAVVQL